jgi:cytochrome c oxidase subunit 5a
MSSHSVEETDEEFYSKYEAYFNRSDIDGWETRKAMADLACQDAIAEPKVIKKHRLFFVHYGILYMTKCF